MSDARIEGYARALFEIARAEGNLDEVEDELFRFARSYESSDALRAALTDDMVPADRRQGIVESLLEGQATRRPCSWCRWSLVPAVVVIFLRSSTASSPEHRPQKISQSQKFALR